MKERKIPTAVEKTKAKVFILGSVCYRMKFDRKRCPVAFYKVLLHRGLVSKSGRLTDIGCALAYKQKRDFLSIQVPVRNISDEQKERLKQGIRKKNVKA